MARLCDEAGTEKSTEYTPDPLFQDLKQCDLRHKRQCQTIAEAKVLFV